MRQRASSLFLDYVLHNSHERFRTLRHLHTLVYHEGGDARLAKLVAARVQSHALPNLFRGSALCQTSKHACTQVVPRDSACRWELRNLEFAETDGAVCGLRGALPCSEGRSSVCRWPAHSRCKWCGSGGRERRAGSGTTRRPPAAGALLLDDNENIIGPFGMLALGLSQGQFDSLVLARGEVDNSGILPF